MQIRHRAALLAAVSPIVLSGMIGAVPALAADSPSTAPAPARTTAPAPATTTAPAPATTTAPAPAKTAAPVMTFMTRGSVAALSGLNLTVNGDNGTNLMTVAPDAAVTVNGSVAKLAQVPVGAKVTVSGTVNNNVKVATRIEAFTEQPFAAAGSVTTVDGTARTVAVLPLLAGSSAVAKVYPVAVKATVTLDGKPVDLAKLPARAHIVLGGTVTGGVYSAQMLTAISRWDLNLSGTVSAVDAARGTVTVTVNTGSPAAALTLTVDPKAGVQVNGVPVTLSALPIGATVNLTGRDSITGATVLGITARTATDRKNR